ncbi:MAG TPA: hypothetical protein VHO47_00135 [Candidatus Babeliales bacterium]|nr:hypothetical protein [Candidatus Babeliales bacterium]
MNKKMNFSVLTLTLLFMATHGQASWYDSFTPVLPHFPFYSSSLLTVCDIARDKIVSAVQHPAAGWIAAGLAAASAGYFGFKYGQKSINPQIESLKTSLDDALIDREVDLAILKREGEKKLAEQRQRFQKSYDNQEWIYKFKIALITDRYARNQSENTNLKEMLQKKDLCIKRS